MAPETAVGAADTVACWCCGARYPEQGVVRLGNHPEVAVCIHCAHYLKRRARAREASVTAQRLRGKADAVRGAVMERGWHDRHVLGKALRWVDKHLPW